MRLLICTTTFASTLCGAAACGFAAEPAPNHGTDFQSIQAAGDVALAGAEAKPQGPDGLEIRPTAWPSFRNGNRLLGVAATTLPEELDVLWKHPAPDGVASTAAIVGEHVFIGTLSGELLCLHRATGERVWAYRTIEDDDPTAFAPGFKASPTVAADVVYIGDEDGVFHAVERATGKRKWTFKTGGEIISSATVVGERVIFGSYDNSLYCLRAADGEKLWSVVTEGYVNCSPATDGKHTFITGCDEHLRIVEIETGKEIGDMEIRSYLIASPALFEDILYFGTYASEVLAVDWKKQDVLWRYKDPRREFPYYSSAAITDEYVVVGGRDKHLHGIDRKTGEGRWTFATRARIDGSPVIVGDRVFVGSSDGHLYEVGLNDGKERWKFRIGRDVTASPAVGEGVLVIGGEGTDEFIYCFGKK